MTKKQKRKRNYYKLFQSWNYYVIIILFYFVFIENSAGQKLNKDSLATSHLSKTNKYLIRDPLLWNQLKINDNGIYIYKDSVDKNIKREEFFMPWEKMDFYKNLLGKKSYINFREILSEQEKLKIIPTSKGRKIKVAIDPGHIAGNIETARIEGKYVAFSDMPGSKNGKDTLTVIEGILTLQTGLILKSMLEKSGYEVMITRTRPDETAFGINYDDWKKNRLKRSLDSLLSAGVITKKEHGYYLGNPPEKKLFAKIFNELDKEERVRKINNFQPDLTVVIHFNVDEKNKDWNKPTEKNFNLCFIGGAFMKEELNSEAEKINFLRLLITDDLIKSEYAAKMLVENFSEALGVQPAGRSDATYLETKCLPHETKGVYSRNLTLTRKIISPVIFGETLFQDNLVEATLLQDKSIEMENFKTSKRVHSIAESYYSAIVQYFKSRSYTHQREISPADILK